MEPVAARRGKRGVSAKKAGRLAALERLKQSKETGKKAYDVSIFSSMVVGSSLVA